VGSCQQTDPFRCWSASRSWSGNFYNRAIGPTIRCLHLTPYWRKFSLCEFCCCNNVTVYNSASVSQQAALIDCCILFQNRFTSVAMTRVSRCWWSRFALRDCLPTARTVVQVVNSTQFMKAATRIVIKSSIRKSWWSSTALCLHYSSSAQSSADLGICLWDRPWWRHHQICDWFSSCVVRRRDNLLQPLPVAEVSTRDVKVLMLSDSLTALQVTVSGHP